MFAGWQAFYQLTGSAAAELIGLLFIVATLTRGTQTHGAEMGRRLFTTPTVVHLATVLTVSALALAPPQENGSACLLMTLGALAGLAYALPIALRLSRQQDPTHWSDFWLYGAAPTALYVALAGTTGAAMAHTPHAAYAVGLVLLALLVVGVRNAWDLVTWLAARPQP